MSLKIIRLLVKAVENNYCLDIQITWQKMETVLSSGR